MLFVHRGKKAKRRVVYFIRSHKWGDSHRSMFATLLHTCILRTILERLKDQARKWLRYIRRNTTIPRLVNDGAIFVGGKGKESLLTTQGAILGPHQFT